MTRFKIIPLLQKGKKLEHYVDEIQQCQALGEKI